MRHSAARSRLEASESTDELQDTTIREKTRQRPRRALQRGNHTPPQVQQDCIVTFNAQAKQSDYSPAVATAPYHSVNVTGISTAAGSNQVFTFTDELRLLPDDDELTLRLFLDHTIAEAYFQERVAMTMALARQPADGGGLHLELHAAQAGATLVNAQVWSVAPIWVSPDDVVSAPRPSAQRAAVEVAVEEAAKADAS